MTLHTLLAIDPGINGGLVLINFVEHTLQAWVMPTEPKNEHGQNRGRQVSPKGLMALAHAHGLQHTPGTFLPKEPLTPVPDHTKPTKAPTSLLQAPGTFLPSSQPPKPTKAPQALYGAGEGMDGLGPRHVAGLEDVYSMPRDGVVSAFTFGEGKGMIRMWLEAIHRPVHKISPSIWKRDLGLLQDKSIINAHARKKESKERAIATAKTVFRGARDVLETEGMCEAALIGLWVGAYHGMQGYDYGTLQPLCA